MVIGALIALSLVGGAITLNFFNRVMDALSIEGTESRLGARVTGIALILGADYLIMRLMLGRLSGIRPPRKALNLGCIAGALASQLLRVPMALILSFSVDKPQYGALTMPIGIVLVLYLNSLTVFAAAALTAGFAERDIPIEEIKPVTDIETAQISIAE